LKGKAGETPQTYLENKWLSNSSIQKKTGPNNGTKVVSKEDRGTAMAVCLEKRSGKSDLTAVSSEE